MTKKTAMRILTKFFSLHKYEDKPYKKPVQIVMVGIIILSMLTLVASQIIGMTAIIFDLSMRWGLKNSLFCHCLFLFAKRHTL